MWNKDKDKDKDQVKDKDLRNSLVSSIHRGNIKHNPSDTRTVEQLHLLETSELEKIYIDLSYKRKKLFVNAKAGAYLDVEGLTVEELLPFLKETKSIEEKRRQEEAEYKIKHENFLTDLRSTIANYTDIISFNISKTKITILTEHKLSPNVIEKLKSKLIDNSFQIILASYYENITKE